MMNTMGTNGDGLTFSKGLKGRGTEVILKRRGQQGERVVFGGVGKVSRTIRLPADLHYFLISLSYGVRLIKFA